MPSYLASRCSVLQHFLLDRFFTESGPPQVVHDRPSNMQKIMRTCVSAPPRVCSSSPSRQRDANSLDGHPDPVLGRRRQQVELAERHLEAPFCAHRPVSGAARAEARTTRRLCAPGGIGR